MAKKVPNLASASGAVAGDKVLVTQSGVVKNVDIDLLPVSAAQAAIIAQKVDAATLATELTATKNEVKQRENQTGNMPAANAILSDGRTVEAVLRALELAVVNPGSSAPVNTAQPGAPTVTGGGSVAVGAEFNAATGTWTGASSYLYQWYQQNTSTGVRTAIVGANANKYTARASDAGFKLIYAVAGVSATGVPSLYVFASAPTATALTATPPSNTSAPTLSVSGAQPVGTVVTLNPGTWSNASGATILNEFLLDGLVVLSGAANTYTLLNGDRGKTLTGRVSETTAQGTGTATTSNSVTVSGSTGITNLTAPAFPATVTVGQPAPITSATWNDIVQLLETRIYVGSNPNHYATISPLLGSQAVYTPEADGSTFLKTATGLDSLVGQTIYCAQLIDFNGQQVLSPKSAGKVVSAPGATLAAQVDVPSIVLTVGVPVTAFRPVSATGGTLPRTWSWNAASNIGIAIDPATGFVSGTPTATFALASVTVTITDAAGSTPATGVFQLQVQQPSATALASAFQAGADYALEAPEDGDSTPYNAKPKTNGLSIPPFTNMASTVYGGVLTLGAATVNGLPVLRHEIRPSHPLRNDGRRSELSYDSARMKHGVDYWMAFALKLDSDWTTANSGGSSDQQSIMQTHQEPIETTLTNGGPFGIIWRGGHSNQEFRIFSNGPDDDPVDRFYAPSVAGKWMRFILHYRSGVTAQQGPQLELWQAIGSGAYTKLTDLAPGTLFGDPAQNTTRDWPKTGIYKWNTGNPFGSTTKRGMADSGLFWAQGASLFQNAAKSLETFARDD